MPLKAVLVRVAQQRCQRFVIGCRAAAISDASAKIDGLPKVPDLQGGTRY